MNHIHQNIVQMSNVTKVFGSDGQLTAVVRNVNLQARCGELLVLMGPSGSGKTTLLTLMAGLISPSEGSVVLFGKDTKEYALENLQRLRAKNIGFIFQVFHLLDPLTVLENVSLVLRFAGHRKRVAQCLADELLKQFHIEHVASKFPPQLSQGEKQRVAIARAIANDANLILADEPTASLETTQGFEVIRILHEYAKSRAKCVVIATHDMRLLDFADRVIRLEDGCIIERTAE
ncbi:MAG: ABC transporter, ATP-binding protein [Bacteroidetes bacterium]|nr:ABC transporter, ATP-binding protein [Bacteroidota bacterium]